MELALNVAVQVLLPSAVLHWMSVLFWQDSTPRGQIEDSSYCYLIPQAGFDPLVSWIWSVGLIFDTSCNCVRSVSHPEKICLLQLKAPTSTLYQPVDFPFQPSNPGGDSPSRLLVNYTLDGSPVHHRTTTHTSTPILKSPISLRCVFANPTEKSPPS